MVLYEDTGNRGKLLQKIYEALKGIPPTSTEAEARIQTRNIAFVTFKALCFLCITTKCFLKFSHEIIV